MPAANALSTHVCPMVTLGTPPIPHVNMLAIPMGASTVLINGVPAVVIGDMFLCVGPPASVVFGSPNILLECQAAAAAVEAEVVTERLKLLTSGMTARQRVDKEHD